VLSIRRDFPARFWTARAVALGEVGRIADAEMSLREAARVEPENAQPQVDVGTLCMMQGKFDEAEAPFTRALELDPGNPYATVMRVHSRMQCCVWDGLDASLAQIAAAIEDPKSRPLYNAVPFPLLALPLGAPIELAAARRWAGQIAATAAKYPLEARRARGPGGRLRVGFVSSDFRDHPVAYLLIECCERIDRTRIETFAYGLTPQDTTGFGRRVVRAFDRFIDCSGEAAEQTARRIAADGIDLLIDLNGYTTHSRSEIFALKPAPVQIGWLGYLGTLGAPWYDYVLTDRFAAPAELQRFFSERFLYLPDCYCPSDTQRPIAPVAPTRAACGLPEHGFVFCCFNHCYKILPELFAVWMRLLAQVPGSVLWLAPANAIAGANLRREAAARGIDPERLVFAPRVSLPEHLARHVHADLFLDTTPYNAGTTANDALFMGVPVLTCAGATLASRVAGSQLHAIGLPELVTTCLADYQALALELATVPQRLASLRQRLTANRHTQPLFDMARFTRALDDLLHSAWENRSSPSNPPALP
jgi:predicted O-linked N-acetylglucosamine transferase (SPINDLY family)